MALNGTQKYIIDSILSFNIDTCLDATVPPEVKLMAFKAMIGSSFTTYFHREQLEKPELWFAILEVHNVLSHKHPQNRRVGDPAAANNQREGIIDGYVYYWLDGFGSESAREPQGLLGLTARNDGVTSPVTKKDVETYIKHKIYLEIYKLTRFLEKTKWILNTIEETDFCNHSLECEGCKISITAPKSLSKKSNIDIANDNIRTTITAMIKNPQKIALIAQRLQNENPSINLRIPGGSNRSAAVRMIIREDNAGYIDIGTHFKGNDLAMGTLMNVFNQLIFGGEIPLFLLNFMREAVGQELMEYQQYIPYEENVGNRRERINKISEVIGSQSSNIIALIGEYDYSSTNEGLVHIETVKEKIHQHLQRQEFDQAVRYAQQASDLGDREALVTLDVLASRYAFGIGVPKDLNLATKLYQQCAALGDKDALGHLHILAGMYFLGGDEVPKDINLAAKLFQQCAVLGHKDALSNLHAIAGMYFLGNGVTKDINLATKLIQECAVLGHEDALSNLYLLAEMYFLGNEVSKDINLAAKLYQQCTTLGHKDALGDLNRVAIAYAKGEGIQQNIKFATALLQQSSALGFPETYFNLGVLSEINVPSDFKRAAEYFMQAAQLGFKAALGALVNIGKRYYDGRGVIKDEGYAVALFTQSADLGDQYAKFNLGLAFLDGRGVFKDLKRAAALFKEAADLGNKNAVGNLTFIGSIFSKGKDVEQDLKYAVELFQQAVGMGDSVAMIELGIAYIFEKGVSKDLKRAAGLFKQAGDLGNALAGNNLNALGFTFSEGTEVPMDMEYAIELYKQAATLGHKDALNNLYSVGNSYYVGYRVTQNITLAVELYHYAADLGHPGAIYNFAVACVDALKIPRDLERAAKLFKQAADLGHADSINALNELGVWYFEGEKVKQDLKRAGELFRQAMQFGLPEAQQNYQLVCGRETQLTLRLDAVVKDICATTDAPSNRSDQKEREEKVASDRPNILARGAGLPNFVYAASPSPANSSASAASAHSMPSSITAVSPAAARSTPSSIAGSSNIRERPARWLQDLDSKRNQNLNQSAAAVGGAVRPNANVGKKSQEQKKKKLNNVSPKRWR